MIKTVEFTEQLGLCSSCGICKNVCPKGAIIYKRKEGMFFPYIASEKCVTCGLCTKVCPGLGTEYTDEKTAIENVYGDSVAIYNAWSKNPDARHVSASGGVVSTLVQVLLQKGLYDVAFCVDSYDYHKQLKTRAVHLSDLDAGIENTSFSKSRYLAVSHEELVAFIKDNRRQRIIIIGTSCAIQGIRKVLKLWNRDETQYLLIGLFCDKVFNYNVLQYFEEKFAEKKELTGLHFKNKESGGWPGNMKLMFRDGSFEYQPKEEREKVKVYFAPERCLYCIDKLNVQADISLGDNYTDQDSSPLGSNTVFIRTRDGETAWNAAAGYIEFHTVEQAKVGTAQYLDGRLNNRYFAAIKEYRIQKKNRENIKLNQGISLGESLWDYEQAYNRVLNRLHAGAVFSEDPTVLQKLLVKEKKSNNKSLVSLAERIYFVLKRRMMKRSKK